MQAKDPVTVFLAEVAEMDRTVHTATAHQRLVRRRDDGVGSFTRDVARTTSITAIPPIMPAPGD
jgi:hypothetical protein